MTSKPTDALFDAMSGPLDENPLEGYTPDEPSPFDAPADEEEDELAALERKLAEAKRKRELAEAERQRKADEEWAAAEAAALEAAKPKPVEAPPVPQVAGGRRSIQVGVTISLSDFGLGYSSVNASQTFEAAELLDTDTAAQVTDYLSYEITQQLVATVAERVTAQVKAGTAHLLPARTAGAGYGQLPAGGQGAPQGAPTGSYANQVGQVLNGQATAELGEMCKIPMGKNDKGQEEFMYFPHPDRLGRRELAALVAEQAALPVKDGGINVHPSQIRVFDNREDFLNGTGQGYSPARIIVADAGNQAAAAAMKGRNGKAQALSYVKFDRLGKPILKPTPQMKELDLELQLALKQPAA